MTPPILKASALALCASLSAGCGADGTTNATANPAPVAETSPMPSPTPTPTPVTGPSLPRLAAGPHLGMITGFDPLDDARAAIADNRYQQARDAGATIGRVQIDWAELETGPGEFDEVALDEAFQAPELAGMNLVVLVSTLDSDGLTLPTYLMDGDELRDGLTLDSPEVRDAFLAFLDWLAPRLESRDVWLLSIGNEVIGPIEDGLLPEAEAVNFYAAAFDQWNAEVPDIGITLTFTIGAPDGIPDLFSALRQRGDIVSFNYYCLDENITVTGPTDWDRRLSKMKSDAGDQEIFMQELGCPVGFDPGGPNTSIGGSLENQTAFFQYFGDQFANDPQLRGATLFQLFDWSPELAESFSAPLTTGFPVAGERLEEWLATVGLVRWTEQTDRPAWQEWLNANRKVAEARGQ